MNIEVSEILLNNGITFLVVTSAIVIAVLAYYLVKLIKDVSMLTKNLNETSVILNTELKPTLQELNDTMKSINSIIQSTDEGVGTVKTSLENAITKTKALSDSLLGGFFKGFLTVFNWLNKKK